MLTNETNALEGRASSLQTHADRMQAQAAQAVQAVPQLEAAKKAAAARKDFKEAARLSAECKQAQAQAERLQAEAAEAQQQAQAARLQAQAKATELTEASGSVEQLQRDLARTRLRLVLAGGLEGMVGDVMLLVKRLTLLANMMHGVCQLIARVLAKHRLHAVRCAGA